MDTIKSITDRWTNPELRPLFKGSLIDADGCCCAQGDILRNECAMTDDQLRNLNQSVADRKVAEELGISLFHSVLLRKVNDTQDGCPQDVLTDPGKVLGPEWERVLSLGWHLHRMTNKQWNAAMDAARAAAGDAWAAAGEAAGAARAAAWAAAMTAAGDAAMTAAGAANEVQGWEVMNKKGQALFFLPLFGFHSIEDILIVPVFQKINS